MAMPRKRPQPYTEAKLTCDICGCPLNLSTGACPRESRHPWNPSPDEIAAACEKIKRAAGLPTDPVEPAVVPTGSLVSHRRPSYAGKDG